MGVVLTDKGVKPDPKKHDCVQSMTPPTNKGEMRRFLGVVTCLSRFSEDFSTKSEPLRTLLKKDTVFVWEENEQKALDEIKALISTAPLLKYFNQVETVEVQVDASSNELGACLMQGGQPIQLSSRALTETEKRYSQIEKEMLSIVYGLTRFHTYTYGRKLTIYNDHKPLAAILRKPVEDNPVRPRECSAELWAMTLNSIMLKGKTLLLLMPLADLKRRTRNEGR